jgi:hypothetical protein
MTNDNLVVLVGELVQAELDKRIDSLHNHVAILPFEGPTVITWDDFAIVLANNFTHSIQTELRKRFRDLTTNK